jgi:hypothetical protein
MKAFRTALAATAILSIGSAAIAQNDDTESLKMEALKALMSAPPERALPIIAKVLKGNGSDELKRQALFVLGQIDLPESRALLLDTARTGDTSSARKRFARSASAAIGRMKELGAIYAAETRTRRRRCWRRTSLPTTARACTTSPPHTQDPEEFERAVEKLGAMGATEELRSLRDRPVGGEALIRAYAIAGDVESLTAMARRQQS